MNERERIVAHRNFIQKEKRKKQDNEQMIDYLNKQQIVLFGEIVNPVKIEELI